MNIRSLNQTEIYLLLRYCLLLSYLVYQLSTSLMFAAFGIGERNLVSTVLSRPHFLECIPYLIREKKGTKNKIIGHIPYRSQMFV